MKKTYKYIALAALALGFTACTQDDDFAPQQEDIVKIASANIATEVQTRVNTLDGGTEWGNNDRILLVNNSRNNKNSGIYKATITGESTYWSLNEGLVLYASGTNATNDFTAYYPAVADKDYVLPTDQGTAANIKYADRMVATTDGVAKGEPVALQFERQHAMITITPTLATEFTGKSIDHLNIGNIIVPYHLEDEEGYTAIIAPSENGFEVTVTVGNQQLTAATSTKIEAGKHYTFDLKVGKDAVEITSVSITKWDEIQINNVDTEEVPSDTYDATTMTAKQLNVALAKALTYGHTNISVKLAADAGEDMFKAITTAFASDGIEPGSIDLTISGVETVPERAFDGDQYQNENYEAMTVLKSVTLPDATQLDDFAFYYCLNMTRFSAPQVVTMGKYALYNSEKLTEVDLPLLQNCGNQAFGYLEELKAISLPSLTTLGESSFASCNALETVNAPNATVIYKFPFRDCNSLTKVTLGAVVTVYYHNDEIGGLFEYCTPGNIDLVLSPEQKVMEKTKEDITYFWKATETSYDGSTDHQNNSFVGYILKSITFAE